MARQPVFAGLIVDENDQPVGISLVGEEPCYVVNDAGFLRHIPSEQVDRQVLQSMLKMVEGNEGLISEQAAKMLGQEDPFSKAMIENQLKHLDDQIGLLLNTGLPEESRTYLGMMGFRIRINMHGEILEIEQPGMIDPGDES